MFFIGENIFKKTKKKDELVHLKEELENKYNQLKENIFYAQQLVNTGSWTYDLVKGETFWSDEVYNILQCNHDELKNKLDDFCSYIHPDDVEEVKKSLQFALEGREYDIVYRIIPLSSGEKYIREKTKVLYDENKNPIKIFGIIQDITVQKLIEKDLRAFGEDLNRAQRVAGVGSWKYDVIKDEIFWSEEIYRIYGTNPMNFQSFLKLIYPEDRINMKNAVNRCLEGKAYKLEYRILQNDGLIKYVETKGEPIFDKEGQVVGILGTLQDITKIKVLEKELKKSNEILSKAQALSHVGSWELDIIHKKSYWSDEAYKIYGITPEEYDNTYEGFLKFVYPADVKIIENMLKNPSNKPFDMEFRIIRLDGSIRNVYQRVEFVFNEKGKPIYIYGTIQDITEKKELQKAIEYKQKEINNIQKRFQVLIQESNDIFEIIDPDGTIKYINGSVEKITGYKSEELIGKKTYEFLNGEELEKLTKMVELVLNNPDKKVQGDIVFKRGPGKEIYLEIHMQNLLHEPAVEGIIINYRDITRRVEMEKKMAYISTHDSLTDLPNGVYFKKKLRLYCEHARKTHTRFALMMLDIDGLKYINYSLGYDLGNELIIEIVQRLRVFLGEDKFISRYSEDHFAIIVEGLRTDEEYENIAKEIINLFSNSYKVKAYEVDVGINIGISIYPYDGQDVDSLKKQSKIALLRAKKEGKNTYKFYSSDLDIQNYKEFILRSDLHNAIDENQLKVYYQPIIQLETHEIIGVESLIRWEHPDWGEVSPDEFIYLAEETGLIIDIGKWILREVCKNYKQWISKGLPDIKVSVNFSGIQFLEKDFVKNIKSIVDEFELEPNFLIMEITESILFKNTDKVVSDVESLQSFGIQVALDDFGTGFSSLSYLTSLNIDILKLDASFIKNIPLDETCTAIIRFVIDLARELKIKLIAEGIENWEQLSYLKDLNCYAGQGFIYTRPVSLEDFEKILVNKKCKPITIRDVSTKPHKDRRKFFRIKFAQLLETDLTILEIKKKKINVGNTKVLVKNIGPGGLCFISNIKFPVEKDIILQFTTQIIEEIKVYGHPVWIEEVDNNLYEYGVKFTIDENERMDLTKILNQVQIKMRKNILFAEGSFIAGSYAQYFNVNDTKKPNYSKS